MSVVLPFFAEPRYRVATVLDETTFVFDVYWNTRDEAWYFNILTEEEELIYPSIKVVLGTALGRQGRSDSRFPRGLFIASDLSGQNLDAGLEDLGERVLVYYYSENEDGTTV